MKVFVGVLSLLASSLVMAQYYHPPRFDLSCKSRSLWASDVKSAKYYTLKGKSLNCKFHNYYRIGRQLGTLEIPKAQINFKSNTIRINGKKVYEGNNKSSFRVVAHEEGKLNFPLKERGDGSFTTGRITKKYGTVKHQFALNIHKPEICTNYDGDEIYTVMIRVDDRWDDDYDVHMNCGKVN